MTKVHLVVLGFLNKQPMYGYKIGQIISERMFSVWIGIKLPSIYKAMQTLEQKGYITGKEESDSNNPPRTVYSISGKGRNYLRELLIEAFTEEVDDYHQFWLAVSFSNRIFDRKELLDLVDTHLQKLVHLPRMNAEKHCPEMMESCKKPFGHRHLVELGDRMYRLQQKTIKELRMAVASGEYDEYLIDNGEQV